MDLVIPAMRHGKNSCIGLLLLPLLLLLNPLHAAAEDNITLQLKWKHAFQFAGFYIAKEKGFYDAEDLNVNIIEGGPGKNPIEHVLAGSGHYAITDTGIILSRSENKPVKALAAIFQHSPLALAVTASSGIKTFEDLGGKRAMMQSGHMDAVILAAINKSGLSNDDFIRQDTSFNIQDLIDGNTDAFSVYVSDQPHQLQEMGVKYRILHPVEYGIDFYGDILVTSEKELKQHNDRADAFMQASLKGWIYALDHIDETIELIQSKYNTQNLSTGQLYFEAQATIDLVLKDVVQIGYMSQMRWQKIIDTYAELGLISSSIPAEALIYTPNPKLSDFIGQYLWQLLAITLVTLLLIFFIQSKLLRQMVRTRTEELAESESRFRTLVGNIPGTVFRCRPDNEWSMEFLSSDIENITGYPVSDFINNHVRSYRSIIHTDDKATVVEGIQHSLQHNTAYTFAYRILRADGTTLWVEESGQPGHLNADNSPWIDGFIFDISERKRSEELKKATSSVLEMVAGNENLILIFNEIIALYEKRHKNMRASILLLKEGQLFKGAAPNLPDAYNEAIDGLKIGESVGSCGTAAFLKKRIIVEDIEHDPLWAPYTGLALPHNLRACWSEPICGASGEVLGTFAMYYDHPNAPDEDEIADISNAAQLTALAIERDHFTKSLHKFSQAVEQTAEVITITDNSGIIEYVNPAFTTITGYSAQEAIGRTPHLFRDESYGELAEEIRHVIGKGDTWQGKIIEKKKDGTRYPAMLTISPIRNEKGEITHHVGVHEDLSKLQEMEEKFYQAQKMEAVGTLVGGIAHDFNNMLAGITGNLYLAKSAASGQLKVTEKLERIENLSGRAADMIKQLLTFANKDIVQKCTVPLTPFLKETLKLHQVSVPENVSLNLDIHDNLQVFADITQLQQVLLNLITNARDAVVGVENPRIDIKLEKFTADATFQKKHEAYVHVEYAHLCVSDNGHGITDEHLDHIFEPFYSTKEVGKGTGLGLSMVFGSLKSHNGFIEVDSEIDGGSSFHIYLPLLKHAPEQESSSPMDVFPGSGETILLSDDEVDVLDTIGEVLTSLGYRILRAKDGQDALNQFEAHSDEIDLILTDIVMPRMGGFQLAEQARKIKPRIPIIFATGYDKKLAIGFEHELQHTETMNKPFSVELLAQTIRKMLDS